MLRLRLDHREGTVYRRCRPIAVIAYSFAALKDSIFLRAQSRGSGDNEAGPPCLGSIRDLWITTGQPCRRTRMMRNRWQLGALCCAALFLGIAGGTTLGPATVHADAAGRASGAPAPRPSGVRCKLTKECQKISAEMICQKFGDHKECMTPAYNVPAHPNT